MSKKFMAELLGTFILVFFGCGAAVIAGADGTTGIGLTGISLAFGLTIVAAAYGFGAISGAHLNPAVSAGFLATGRMTGGDFVSYVIAQVAGAILAALVLYLIASGQPDYALATHGLGANGYGPDYLGGYNLTAALLFEVVATFVFVSVILGATHASAPKGFAGLAIGLTLTMIHLVGIKITGTSVNPARSIGPALFVGGDALKHLWVFIAAPLAGGILAGMAHKAGFTRAD
ncbi:MAG: aquaporin Z [Paracoccaceae bacterium]